MPLTRRAALAPLLALALLSAAAGVAHAELNNTVTQWLAQAQQAVRADGIQNQLSTRLYALVALAQLRAIDATPQLDPTVAAAVAGHAVLATLFPFNQSAVYDGLLKAQIANATGGKPFTPAQIAARKAVSQIAKDLITEYTGGASAEYPIDFKFAAPGETYKYQATPGQKYALYPQLANAKPIVVASARLDAIAGNTNAAKGPVFRPPSPHGADYEATRLLGSNATDSTRSKYDSDTAIFWADGGNTSAISGHWLDIAKKVLPDTLSVRDTALFFARAFSAAWDASIACWKVKYSTLHWRPVTAFQAGYPADGAVAAAKGDATWWPLIKTPPHPEYPSGHQCTVGALLETLVRQLGTDKVAFTIGSEGTPWLERSYQNLTSAAVEVGDSRLYGGVHFNSSNVDGLKLGRLVASEVYPALQNGKVAAPKPPSLFNRIVSGH